MSGLSLFEWVDVHAASRRLGPQALPRDSPLSGGAAAHNLTPPRRAIGSRRCGPRCVLRRRLDHLDPARADAPMRRRSAALRAQVSRRARADLSTRQLTYLPT